MSIENTDLLLIQRGDIPYRDTVENFKDYTNSSITPDDVGVATTSKLGVVQVGNNLQITPQGVLSAVVPNALVYMGVHTNPAQAPSITGIVPGQFWIWEGGNSELLTGATYGAIQNKLINNGDHIIWSSSNDWDLIPTSGDQGVVTVQGNLPIEVVDGSTSTPTVGIRASSNSQSGSMSSTQATKLSGIQTGAQVNVNPTQVYTQLASNGRLTLNPGGDQTTLPAATTTKAGLMSGTDKTKLSGIQAGAQVNVNPTQTLTRTTSSGTLVLSPGGDETVIGTATTTEAGLMSGADKTALDDLVSNPSGVVSFTAGNGLTDTGTAKNPVANVDFGSLPNGTAASAKVMPYSIAMLGQLP